MPCLKNTVLTNVSCHLQGVGNISVSYLGLPKHASLIIRIDHSEMIAVGIGCYAPSELISYNDITVHIKGGARPNDLLGIDKYYNEHYN